MAESGSTFTVQPTAQARYTATRSRRKTMSRRRTHQDDITYLNITPMLDMMTIILVFLIKSFASSSQNVNVANLNLPHSTTKLNIEEALQLMVTPNEIMVAQSVVTKLNGEGYLPEEEEEEGGGYLIKSLYDALHMQATTYKEIDKFGGSQFSGRIAVIADRTVSYETLFKVLYTAGQAEFGEFKLFVHKPQD